QDDCRTSSPGGGWIVHPETATPCARLFALEGVIMISLRRDRYFFLLRDDAVPLPLTLRTAIEGGQGYGDRDPKPVSTRTFDFGWARCILILGDIGHLGSATLGAAQRRPLVLITVDGAL